MGRGGHLSPNLDRTLANLHPSAPHHLVVYLQSPKFRCPCPSPGPISHQAQGPLPSPSLCPASYPCDSYRMTPSVKWAQHPWTIILDRIIHHVSYHIMRAEHYMRVYHTSFGLNIASHGVRGTTRPPLLECTHVHLFTPLAHASPALRPLPDSLTHHSDT